MSSSLYSETWIEKVPESIDLNKFTKSLKFGTNLRVCKIDDVHDSLVGVDIHHQDLFMFTENVRKKGEVMFMDTNILQGKAGNGFGALGLILGTGSNRNKDGRIYVNMVQIPILGIVTEALGLDGIACFHPKNKFFFYSSAIDPTAVDYMQYYALIDAVSLFTTNGIMSMIIDCLASETYSKVSTTSTVGKYSANIIDSFPHSYGCNGGVTLGSANHSKSPLVNGLISSASTLKILSRTGYVIMQSKNSILNGQRDVSCKQLKGPFIKSQFTPQQLVPVVTKQFVLGTTPAEWAAFRDNQSSKGDTVYAWWVDKDFVAYSGTCVW